MVAAASTARVPTESDVNSCTRTGITRRSLRSASPAIASLRVSKSTSLKRSISASRIGDVSKLICEPKPNVAQSRLWASSSLRKFDKAFNCQLIFMPHHRQNDSMPHSWIGMIAKLYCGFNSLRLSKMPKSNEDGLKNSDIIFFFQHFKKGRHALLGISPFGASELPENIGPQSTFRSPVASGKRLGKAQSLRRVSSVQRPNCIPIEFFFVCVRECCRNQFLVGSRVVSGTIFVFGMFGITHDETLPSASAIRVRHVPAPRPGTRPCSRTVPPRPSPRSETPPESTRSGDPRAERPRQPESAT